MSTKLSDVGLRRSLACLLGAAVFSSCAGPPRFDLRFATPDEVRQSSRTAYAVEDGGHGAFSLWSLGGRKRLPVADFIKVCVFEFGKTAIEIFDINPDTACPQQDAAKLIDGSRALLNQPLLIKLYRDSERHYYYEHVGHSASGGSALVIAATYSEEYPISETMLALAHELLHIYDGLQPLQLRAIDEELNAELFGICVVAPQAESRFADRLIQRADDALKFTTINSSQDETGINFVPREVFETFLKNILEYKDRIDEEKEFKDTRK